MLTRNFYSIFPMNPYDIKTENDYNKDRGSSVCIKNPEGKTYVTSDPTDTSKFVKTETESSYGVFGWYTQGSEYTNKSSTKSSFLNMDKTDVGDSNVNNCLPDSYGWSLIYLGSGTTPATLNDYCLQNCIQEYERNRISIGIDYNNLMFTISMQFTPTIELQVSEIGWYQTPCKSYFPNIANPTLKNILALCGRTVLGSPVTFEAGKTYTIDYTIDFKNMTDSVGGV